MSNREFMTRQEYMKAAREGDREAAHRAYYGQFVNQRTIHRVVNHVGEERLLRSQDKDAFNDIPMKVWDELVPWLPGSGLFRKAGDYYTNCGGVCLAKEAARQWLEQQEETS